MTEQTPTTYPVDLHLKDQPTLVVGGGENAYRKVGGLLDAGAAVTVVAPLITDEIRALPVRIFERNYQRGEVASYRLAFTCTTDTEVNAQVQRDADAAGVWTIRI